MGQNNSTSSGSIAGEVDWNDCSFDNDPLISVRRKCGRFRILIVGRANAGKTTLLKQLCNSTEDPYILDSKGNQLDPQIIEGSINCGRHDVERELIFKSNPEFVFHDSRGFESGSTDELQIINQFIAERDSTHTLSQQLHAIWYCLPTDTDRPFLAVDNQFFNTESGYRAPVIAIFTKFDGLVTHAFSQLMGSGETPMQAMRKAPQEAQDKLRRHFREPLLLMKRPPSEIFVRFEDMRNPGDNLGELIEKTVRSLSDEALKLLLVSVQRNNIDLCIGFLGSRRQQVLSRSLRGVSCEIS
ncbi:GTP-binding protein [Mycena venus]|uniref:GTP-binding protein n=1 Tax=Mycena venus TaxID=2733690 RepID=A0A8H6U3G4_9AGAR|nr:GTP-binding protein [Mycena venus]